MDTLLYAPNDPRNVGSIIRTSVGFGLSRLHIYDQHSILTDTKKMEQVSIVCRRGREREIDIVSIQDPAAFLDDYVHKYATVVGPRTPDISTIDFESDGLIIFGNESDGIPRKTSRREGVQKFVIPTISPDHCYGLCTAYGMVLYEYFRQHPNEAPQMRRA